MNPRRASPRPAASQRSASRGDYAAVPVYGSEPTGERDWTENLLTMTVDAGTDLDRQIERKLNGDAKKRTPPYSTSEKTSNRLLRRLEAQNMPCSIVQERGVWYCTFWTGVGDARERIAIGSGNTRALAVARAVMNARLGTGTSLSTESGAVSNRVHRAHMMRSGAAGAGTGACSKCGADLPVRNRDTATMTCVVCSWRASRDPGRGPGKSPGESSSTTIPIRADDSGKPESESESESESGETRTPAPDKAWGGLRST